MKEFFKYTLATITGIVLSFFILFFLGILIISAIASSADDEVAIEPNSILYLPFNTPIVDRANDDPLANGIFNISMDAPIGLNHFLADIDKAAHDPNIAGIFIDASQIQAGIATIVEIRTALQFYKKYTGKPVVAYAEDYSQGAYYLASVADEVYLNPKGNLFLTGLSAELMFFKGTLEKLGVEPEIIRHGKFKAAVEPFILDQMSAENEKQVKTYVGTIWKNISDSIAASRKIDVQKLNQYIDRLALRNADSALQYGLVDSLWYKDQVIARLKDIAELNTDEKLRLVNIQKYHKAPEAEEKDFTSERIAVIYASGNIVSGEGDENSIGASTFARAIRDARENEKVKAIVLRVNSPGGSALASEVILRELELAQAEKPLVVSMGNLAASGGYYIACKADTIVAQPTTITGSIGVFGLLFNAQKMLQDKLGITVDRVTTHQYSDVMSVTRKMTDYERNVIQQGVEEVYQTFISHVAQGRNMTKAQVDSIGQGRVWAGENAKQIGLVDVFGGLNDAIAIAQDLADMDNYRLLELPEQKNTFERLMDKDDAQASILQNQLGQSYRYVEHLRYLLQMEPMQARMPYDVDIE